MPAPWEIDLLTNTGIQGFGQEWALNALQAYSFQNDTLATVVGASVIAKLATLFSSFSQVFRYDVTKHCRGGSALQCCKRGSPALPSQGTRLYVS